VSVHVLSRRFGVMLGVTAIVWLGFPTQSAHARDWAPCAPKPSWHWRYGSVWYCPMWRGDVELRRTATPGGPIVGKLAFGGWSNWFKHQCVGQRYTAGRYTNVWWAWTIADPWTVRENGGWGYVSQVYFSGGDPDEADGGGLPRLDRPRLDRPCYMG
jgi:hypothetical protein